MLDFSLRMRIIQSLLTESVGLLFDTNMLFHVLCLALLLATCCALGFFVFYMTKMVYYTLIRLFRVFLRKCVSERLERALFAPGLIRVQYGKAKLTKNDGTFELLTPQASVRNGKLSREPESLIAGSDLNEVRPTQINKSQTLILDAKQTSDGSYQILGNAVRVHKDWIVFPRHCVGQAVSILVLAQGANNINNSVEINIDDETTMIATDLYMAPYRPVMQLTLPKIDRASHKGLVSCGSAFKTPALLSFGAMENNTEVVGEVYYRGSTIPGFSGAGYFNNNSLAGIHLGTSNDKKINYGLAAGFIELQIKDFLSMMERLKNPTAKKGESPDDSTPEYLHRRLQEDDSLILRAVPSAIDPERINFMIDNQYHSMDRDVFYEHFSLEEYADSEGFSRVLVKPRRRQRNRYEVDVGEAYQQLFGESPTGHYMGFDDLQTVYPKNPPVVFIAPRKPLAAPDAVTLEMTHLRNELAKELADLKAERALYTTKLQELDQQMKTLDGERKAAAIAAKEQLQADIATTNDKKREVGAALTAASKSTPAEEQARKKVKNKKVNKRRAAKKQTEAGKQLSALKTEMATLSVKLAKAMLNRYDGDKQMDEYTALLQKMEQLSAKIHALTHPEKIVAKLSDSESSDDEEEFEEAQSNVADKIPESDPTLRFQGIIDELKQELAGFRNRRRLLNQI